MGELSELTQKFIEFRDARDWKKFHNPKDVSIAIAVEAAELLELFQWRSTSELQSFIDTNREKIEDEVADIYMIY